jgi:hypothetical protein
LFPKLYADVVISSAPNSNEAKILARNYQKIIDRIKTNMPNVKVCTHIKVNGVRCGSPALRSEQFCYFHQRMIHGVKALDQRIHHVALLENEEAIQASLMEVINSLIRGTIDLRRADLILRALSIAVRNSRRVHFDIHSSEMVREVPTYKEPWEQPPAVGAADAPVRPAEASAAVVHPTAAEASSHPQANAVPSQAAVPRPPQALEPKPPAQPEANAADRVDSSARQTIPSHPIPRKPPASVNREHPKLRKQAARNVH